MCEFKFLHCSNEKYDETVQMQLKPVTTYVLELARVSLQHVSQITFSAQRLGPSSVSSLCKIDSGEIIDYMINRLQVYPTSTILLYINIHL